MNNKKILLVFVFFLSFSSILFSNENYLKIYSEFDADKKIYSFYADNSHFIPYSFKITFDTLENLKPSVEIPYSSVVKPESKKVFLFNLIPIDNNKPLRLSTTYNYSPGDPNAKHDDTYQYLFPFEHGTKRLLVQGFHGNKTHNNEQNEFALDFDMPIGTPVTAARDGVVIEIKEDSNAGGTGSFYEDKANYITIYHNDGSFSYYVHLKKDGSLVKIGDKVAAGQIIGYSGNTGYSSGPHLHFTIRIATKEGSMKSIPFKLLNYDNNAIEPREGITYYSFHPGKQKFEIVLGINIKNESYDNYNKSIPNNNKIDFRMEQIDETILLFVKNGFKEKYEITVKLNLTNLSASKDLPITTVLEPLTEIYLLFLRRNEYSSAFTNYEINYSYKPIK